MQQRNCKYHRLPLTGLNASVYRGLNAQVGHLGQVWDWKCLNVHMLRAPVCGAKLALLRGGISTFFKI